MPVTIKNDVMTAYESLIKKGEERGIEIGIELGKLAGKMETIVIGYKNGVSIEILALLTGFSEDKVQDIIDEYNRGELDIDI